MSVSSIQRKDVFEQAHATVDLLNRELTEAVYMSDDDRLATIGAWAVGGHILFDGVYGTGKTTIAKTLGAAINGTAARVQGTPDVMASDITGSMVWNRKTERFDFVPGPIFSNVLLVDEMHRMPGKSQSGLVEAMEEGQVTVNGKTYELPEAHLVIATKNPDGQDIAPVLADRFDLGMHMPRQTAQDRKNILHKKRNAHKVQGVVTPEDILNMQRAVEEEVTVSDQLVDVANSLVDRIYSDSRVDHDYTIEGGFRPFYKVLNIAKFAALARKSRNVHAADVAFAAPYVFTHRVVPSDEAQDNNVTSRDIVSAAITAERIPTQVPESK